MNNSLETYVDAIDQNRVSIVARKSGKVVSLSLVIPNKGPGTLLGGAYRVQDTGSFANGLSSRADLVMAALRAATNHANNTGKQLIVKKPDFSLWPLYQIAGFHIGSVAGVPYLGFPFVDPDTGAQKSTTFIERIDYFSKGVKTYNVGYYAPDHEMTDFVPVKENDELHGDTLLVSNIQLPEKDLFIAGTAMVRCAEEITRESNRPLTAITVTEGQRLWATSLGYAPYGMINDRSIWAKRVQP